MMIHLHAEKNAKMENAAKKKYVPPWPMCASIRGDTKPMMLWAASVIVSSCERKEIQI